MPHVYIIHLDPPLQHAKHYVGYTPNSVEARLKLHEKGLGASLTKAAVDNGCQLVVTRVWHHVDWHTAREQERRLKRNSHVPRHCPICNPKKRPKYSRLPVRSKGE